MILPEERKTLRRKLFLLFLIYLVLTYIFTAIEYEKANKESWNIKPWTEKEYVGKVLYVKEYEDNFKLKIRLKNEDLPEQLKDKCILLTYYKKEKNGLGSENIKMKELFLKFIRFKTSLELPTGMRNPNCFDYRLYLKTEGISYIGRGKDIFELKSEENPITLLVDRYRAKINRLKYTFLSKIEADKQEIVAGVIFGDLTMLKKEIYEDFKEKGIAHILAISGLHVNIVFNLYLISIKKRSLTKDLFFIIILIHYGELAMWSSSLCRAVIMIGLKLIAYNIDERYDSLTALSLAGIILITANPYVVFSVGFQLSFLATSSIIFFRPIFKIKLPESLSIILAINLGLLPYMIFKFNYFSLAGILINIPMIYISAYLIPLMIGAFLGFCILAGTGYGYIFIYIAEKTAKVFMEFSSIWDSDMGYGIYFSSPAKQIIVAIIMFMFFMFSELALVLFIRKSYKHIVSIVGVIMLTSIIIGRLNYVDFTKNEFVFIDVGQGDGLHVRMGNKNVIIDGGGNINYNVGEKVLKEYFLKNGVNQLDYAIATHLHMDHFQGICQLSKVFKIKNLVVYKENQIKEDELKRKFRCENIIYFQKGDIIHFDNDNYIKVIGPVDDGSGLNEEDENKNSLVIKAVVNGVSVLMTGDIDKEGEKSVIENNNNEDLKIDILKISHHGSKYSSLPEFIDRLNPKIAVIQVGKNNYGHPSDMVLECLGERNIPIFRNDISGAIGVDAEGNRIKAVYEVIPGDCH